jgi:hypothetical protein
MKRPLCHRIGALSITLLLFSAVPAGAQEARPNTLTPEEISKGWLLLFDGETDFGWKSGGQLSAAEGKLVIKNGGMSKIEARPAGPFADFDLHFEYMTSGKAALAILQRVSLTGLSAPVTMPLPDPENPAKTSWAQAKVSFVDGRLSANFMKRVLTIQPANPTNDLVWTVPADSVLYLRNVKLRPLKMKSLFNDKDLAGWKEFPGKKSKFSVAEGAIHIKNGPGDLQTEGKYADFLLQLECFSNGAHLNSGVFFRCRADEYQNGYEAQIRNQFTATPTQEYTLEEFDPKSHKLLAKKKAKFTAVDYGTGAIYRRQPARKEVAKDGEWFTMTILADQNHYMTWVNGIEVVDWIDNRPHSDNARTGCRLEAGHISLQGHDPTTDLKFRNFRIRSLE